MRKKVFAILYRAKNVAEAPWHDWGGRESKRMQCENAVKLETDYPQFEFWILHQKLIGKYANTAKAAGV